LGQETNHFKITGPRQLEDISSILKDKDEQLSVIMGINLYKKSGETMNKM